MTSQTDKQTIAIHILTSISRSKKKQGMKFGQLIKNSMRRIFLKKSYTKCGEGTIPRPFFKKIKIEQISGYLLLVISS